MPPTDALGAHYCTQTTRTTTKGVRTQYVEPYGEKGPQVSGGGAQTGRQRGRGQPDALTAYGRGDKGPPASGVNRRCWPTHRPRDGSRGAGVREKARQRWLRPVEYAKRCSQPAVVAAREGWLAGRCGDGGRGCRAVVARGRQPGGGDGGSNKPAPASRRRPAGSGGEVAASRRWQRW